MMTERGVLGQCHASYSSLDCHEVVTSAVSLLGLHNFFKLSPFLGPKNDSVLLYIVLPRALGIYYICNQENNSLRLAEIY